MTERRDGRTDRGTLGEQSHTNPYTNEAFGDTQTYARGRTLAADGGTGDATDRGRDADDAEEAGGGRGETVEATDARGEDDPEGTLRDVDHTPRKDAPEASRAYMRGNEDDEEDDA